MPTRPYISCIKINGLPIIPPLMTPKRREECQELKRQALEREKKRERDLLFQKYLSDLESLEIKTKEISIRTSLECRLAFEEEMMIPSVPSAYEKMKNLTSETIDVTEYSDEGVKVLSIDNDSEARATPPKLIRSNSYTLESPSPILLAHLEKEARKCVEMDSESTSPVTIIDSEPPFKIDNDVTIERVTVDYSEDLSPELIEVLDKLPKEHAQNILQILRKQKENNQEMRGFLNEDNSFSVSISSQSLYYSTVSPETPPSKVKNSRIGENKAASIIQAYIRGYLTRRLFRAEKVQGLIETIKDALLCAMDLHRSEIIDEKDVELHRRLIQQVSAACYAFHDVFFELPIADQMGIIALDRQRKIEKAKRPLSATSSNISISRRQSAKVIR